MPRAALVLSALLAAATVLPAGGCGRKGRLEPPPEQQITQRKGKSVDPGPVKPKQSFPLDPLLN